MSHMLLDAENNEDGQVFLKPDHVHIIVKSVAEIARISQELNLDATRDTCIDCQQIFERFLILDDYAISTKSDCERLAWLLDGVRRNLSSQVNSKAIAIFGSPTARFLVEDESPLPENIADRFPGASEEVSEAAKCLALGRCTASVFHLMRALEIAVAQAAGHLDPDLSLEKEWGKLLSDIGRKIEALPKGDLRNNWSENHSLLYHVKQAWRNTTMHPKKTYTVEEATSIFEATRSYMIHLASLLEPTE